MKFSFIASIISIATIVSVTNAAPAICTDGEYACLGNDSAVCNYGQWVITKCGDGNRCLPHDYECVPLSAWSMFSSQIAEATTTTSSSSALSVAAPTHTVEPQSCLNVANGTYSCLGNNSAVCSFGVWSITECAKGTRCMPNDFECIPDADWQSVYNRIPHPSKSSTSSALSVAAPTPTVAPQSCSDVANGTYSCLGDNSAVCSFGVWSITKCAQGTRCMPDDYECIPDADWQSVYNSIPHPTST